MIFSTNWFLSFCCMLCCCLFVCLNSIQKPEQSCSPTTSLLIWNWKFEILMRFPPHLPSYILLRVDDVFVVCPFRFIYYVITYLFSLVYGIYRTLTYIRYKKKSYVIGYYYEWVTVSDIMCWERKRKRAKNIKYLSIKYLKSYLRYRMV